jgi:hypothetical protein
MLFTFLAAAALIIFHFAIKMLFTENNSETNIK